MNEERTILVIDDDDPVRESIADYLADSGYRVETAVDGEDGLHRFQDIGPDLVLLDLRLPGIDGIELLPRITSQHPDTPVIIVSGQASFGDAVQALKRGAWDFLTKPIQDMAALEDAVEYALDRAHSIVESHSYREHLEELVYERTTKLRERKTQLKQALSAIVDVLVRVTEQRDPYTAGHQQRVADLARAIAEEMGEPAEVCDVVHLAGRVHDLGKVAIPSAILAKPGRLTDIEFDLVRTHAEVGHDILGSVDMPWPLSDIVRQHHEKLDGSGYPDGLRGDDIRIEARILTVADVVEAMTSHRPYRPSLGVQAALKEVREGAGDRFDPQVVAACVRLFVEGRFSFHEAQEALG